MTLVCTVMFIPGKMTEEENIWIFINECWEANIFIQQCVKITLPTGYFPVVGGGYLCKGAAYIRFCAIQYNGSVGIGVREWLPQMALFRKIKYYQLPGVKHKTKDIGLTVFDFGSSWNESCAGQWSLAKHTMCGTEIACIAIYNYNTWVDSKLMNQPSV